MQLKGEQLLPVSQQAAWDALNDTALLRQAIPGCESIVPAAAADGDAAAGVPGAYDLVMVAAVGPVKARFTGKLQLENLDPPNAYTIRFEGNGGAAGFGKGTAAVKLVAALAGTRLDYEADASVGGKIAQVGSRIVDMAAKKIAGDCCANFTPRRLDRRAPCRTSGRGRMRGRS